MCWLLAGESHTIRTVSRVRFPVQNSRMLCGLLGILVACQQTTPRASEPASAAAADPQTTAAWFRETATHRGLDFRHFNGMTGELYMAEVMGSGGALLDYDNDGDLDVFLIQGAILGPGKTLADALVPPQHASLPLANRLYRNDLTVGPAGPVLQFTDVTAVSGETGSGYGMGAAAGDYDNDGWVDLYLTCLGHNRLLHNQGDRTFRDMTASAGVDDPRWSVPATFFDFDRDGWLDLFVGNYVAFPFDRMPRCADPSGAPDYCGTSNFAPEPDRLLHNRGDGTFVDVTQKAGLTAGFGPALGVVAADFNDDGWPDLYVANDATPNNLWLNRGNGTFSDEALLAGCAVNAAGQPEASMGVDAGDYDRDGDLDLFMTHLVVETNTLYQNEGRGMFSDRTTASGLGPPSRLFTSFGTGWLDYDNDGWLDLVVVSGAVNKIPELVRQGDAFPLHQTKQLFRNLGDGRFADVTAAAGPAFQLSEVSRGALFGDLDNDGDQDVVVVNNNGPARLLENQIGSHRPWLGVRLVQGAPPRDAVGAKAALLENGRPVAWLRVRTDGSYAAAHDPRLLFALGTGRDRDKDKDSGLGLQVFWPDGTSEVFRDLPHGRYTTLQRGTGEEKP